MNLNLCWYTEILDSGIAKTERAILTRNVLEGNMANDVGFVILSVLEAFCIHFKVRLHIYYLE